MIGLKIHLDGDGCWPDLTLDRTGEEPRVLGPDGQPAFVHVTVTDVSLLRNGTVGGKPTVTFRMTLEGGRVVLAQTTFELLDGAVRAFKARLAAEAEEAERSGKIN